MIKEVQNKTIKGILGEELNKELFYVVPPYQREYAWQKDQWEELFDDLKENEKGYFLGSIICIDRNSYYEIVDGQQRLTTISILLNSIYKRISELAEDNRDILNFQKNKDKVMKYAELEKTLVKNSKKPTLTLSLQNNNNNDYKYILKENTLLQEEIIDKPKNFGNRRISKSFEYFLERLKNENMEVNDIFDFLDKIFGALLVRIVVNDEFSAFTLFESINNRGMPLTPIDLIKNSIIANISKNNQKVAEETNKKWNIIIQNIDSYKDQVRFLRQYYNAFRANSIKGFPKATKTNIIRIYKKLIEENVGFILDDLIEKSKIYKNFISPEEIEEESKFFKYKGKFLDLLNLGVAPGYTLLLYIFSRYSNENFDELLEFLENWFIRRNFTNYPPTSKLDDIFINVIKEVKDKYDFEKIKSIMKKPEYFKSNEEFKKMLLNEPIYTINPEMTRYILLKLERSKRTKENMIFNPWKKKNRKFVWTIEHILPQNPSKNSDWNKYFKEEDKEKYLHRIGNLTLTQYNSNLSNKSFKEKISDKKIGLKSGNIEINKYIIDKNLTIWTKQDIEKRGKELVKDICELLKCE